LDEDEGLSLLQHSSFLSFAFESCTSRTLAYFFSLISEIVQKFKRELRQMAATAVQDGQTLSPAHRSAQFVSEQGLEEIPAAYVRAPEERSNLRESFAEGLPVIDLATAGPAEIGEACYEWGIFQVCNLRHVFYWPCPTFIGCTCNLEGERTL